MTGGDAAGEQTKRFWPPTCVERARGVEASGVVGLVATGDVGREDSWPIVSNDNVLAMQALTRSRVPSNVSKHPALRLK